MTNPWLSIPLADYEAHMALPDVGQAAALASEMEALARRFRPASFALLGCAGGNGLERIDASVTARVVAVDINPAFLRATQARFGGSFGQLETIACDVGAAETAPFDPVDAIFAGLVLEYVPLAPALRFVRSALNAGGSFGCVIQQESDELPHVSASPFAGSLSALSERMRTLTPRDVIDAAAACGLRLIGSRPLAMPNRKMLVSQTYVT